MAQVHNSGLFWGLERLEWLRGVDGSLRHSQLAEKIAKWFLEGVNDPFSVRRYQDSCVAPPPPLPCRAALRGTWQNRSEQYHSLEQAWRRTQKQREALLQTTVGPGRRGRGGGACRLRFGGGVARCATARINRTMVLAVRLLSLAWQLFGGLYEILPGGLLLHIRRGISTSFFMQVCIFSK